MAEPRYTDADLERAYRAGAFDDLTLLSVEPPEFCSCWHRAYQHARAFHGVEYGLVPVDHDGCRRTETWCDGDVRLTCLNSERLWEALSEAGFVGQEAMDAELLRRLDAVAAGEEAVSPEYLAHVEDECRAVEADSRRIAAELEAEEDRRRDAELRASAILAEGGYPGDAIARAGRALRGEAANG